LVIIEIFSNIEYILQNNPLTNLLQFVNFVGQTWFVFLLLVKNFFFLKFFGQDLFIFSIIGRTLFDGLNMGALGLA